jgi:uncharacterized protein with FMN-binding domain
MPKKMSKRLVALSASAVATIYLSGFLSTQTTAQSIDYATADSPAVAAADPTSTSVPSVVVGASATPTTVPTSVPAAVAAATAATSVNASGYADGTYSGTGTSRFGNVYVSVTVAAGKISNVQITRTTTTFPVGRIASLPAQVVQTQSASVNVVTGATYSSQAFKQAVQQALSAALAAGR